MKSLTMTLTLLLTVSALSGCSRIRQMTRRDYAGMEDPFAERPLQDGAIADSRNSRAGDSVPGRGDRLEMNPNSRIRTVGQSRALGSDNTKFAGVSASGLSNSGTGPSLDDFVQKSEQHIATTRDEAAAFGSRATSAVADKTDMAGMTQFLEEQATASGLTETSRELDKDFSEFVASQQQEWSKNAESVKETASPFLNSAQSSVQAFSETIEDANPFAAASREAPPAFSSNPQHAEVATPFIQQTSGQQFGTSNRATPAGFTAPPAVSPGSNPAASIGVTNPFEALLNEDASAGRVSVGSMPESPPAPEWGATQSAPLQTDAVDPFFGLGAPAPQPKTIDSEFSFDSGWKPPGVVQQ